MFKGVNQMLISEIWAKTRNSICGIVRTQQDTVFLFWDKGLADETALLSNGQEMFCRLGSTLDKRPVCVKILYIARYGSSHLPKSNLEDR